MLDLFGRDCGRRYGSRPDAPEQTVDWPEDTHCSFGKKGLVLSREGSYTTMFIEVYPRDGVFIRGEGETAEECEAACWDKWQRHLHCDGSGRGHLWEPRGYRNGVGTCARCGVRERDRVTHEQLGAYCHLCGVATFDRHNDERFSCDAHCLSDSGEHDWSDDVHKGCKSCGALHPRHPIYCDDVDDDSMSEEIGHVLQSLGKEERP